jgi:hypothetical protein
MIVSPSYSSKSRRSLRLSVASGEIIDQAAGGYSVVGWPGRESALLRASLQLPHRSAASSS